MSQNALLLVGSPGNGSSNSHAIGRYLLDRLGKAGWEADEEFIYLAVKDEDRMKQALEKMDGSDLIILSFPLYVDSVPSQMIKFLEKANEHRNGSKSPDQRLIAVCQSGFPESHHNDYALRICSNFAHDAGYHWAGGLSVGGGGAIAGQDLEEAGGMMRKLRESLDLTANAIVGGEDIPQRARDLVSKGTAPPLLYNWVVNRHWKQEARKNRVDLRAKPHA
jgi:hypothetical protein